MRGRPPRPRSRSNAIAHGTPQPCAGAATMAQSHAGSYTSTQLAGIFGQDQVFDQGRTGIGQTIAVVEFEQYLQSDLASFEACYGLSNPITNVAVDGGPGGPPAGAARPRSTSSWPPSARPPPPSPSTRRRTAPTSRPSTCSTASPADDSAQVVTTSWGDCEASIQSTDPAFLQAEKGIFDRMSAAGADHRRRVGRRRLRGLLPGPQPGPPDPPGGRRPRLAARRRRAWAARRCPAASASSQVVWNDCQGQLITCANGSLGGGSGGAGGGGYSTVWPRPSYQPALLPARTGGARHRLSGRPVGRRCRRGLPGRLELASAARASPRRRTPGSSPTPTRAASTGWAGSARRSTPPAFRSGNGNFTDITSGNNDFTSTNGGNYTAVVGYDTASGLGTPIDQDLSIALQGADGCPSVASVSPDTGPVAGRGAITISGGGFADATSVTFGAAGRRPDPLPDGDLHHGRAAERPGPPLRRRDRGQLAGRLGDVGGRPLRLRRRPRLRRWATASWPATAVCSTSVTPASGAAPAASGSTNRWSAWP